MTKQHQRSPPVRTGYERVKGFEIVEEVREVGDPSATSARATVSLMVERVDDEPVPSEKCGDVLVATAVLAESMDQ
jgi:hypothetical protein